MRLALHFYVDEKRIIFHKNTSFSGPKIIAANHPNSFFDAIAIAVFYKKPIYFLARGDAFKKPLVAKLLKKIHLIPIFRISEGIDNLAKNQATFELCVSLLKQNKTILIFSEGVCVNEWKLRAIKKGTARICYLAYQNGVEDLIIQPTAINYNSFSKIPKDLNIYFNEEINLNNFDLTTENQFYSTFNSVIKDKMRVNLIEQNATDEISLFEKKKSSGLQILLVIPAIIGYISQKWLYNLVKNNVAIKTKNTVFFDSILFGSLLFIYPIFIILCALIATILLNFKIGLLVFIALPVTGFAYKKYKSVI